MSLSFFLTTPARKPRTECCCQSVVFMMAAMVVPFGCRSIASTVSCLDGAEVAGFDGRDFFGAAFDAAGGLLVRLAGRRTEAGRLACGLGGFWYGFAGSHRGIPSCQRQHHVLPLARPRRSGGAMEDCGGGG